MRDRPADLPVAAPDPASVIEHFLTLRSPAFMDELPRWSDAKKEARAALAALLVERQQDKERIERLEAIEDAAHKVYFGPSKGSVAVRSWAALGAALAVEEDGAAPRDGLA